MQMFSIDGHDRAVGDGPGADEPPAVRQHVDLARELAGTKHGDGLFAPVDRTHGLDGAFDDDEEANVLLAELEQNLAGADAAPHADSRDSLDLRGGQLRKHFVPTLDVGN